MCFSTCESGVNFSTGAKTSSKSWRKLSQTPHARLNMETWHKVLLLTSIYVSFLLTGTLIFQALEKGEEEILRVQVRNNLMTFLVNNTCVDEWELRFIVNEVVHAYSYGLRFEDNNMTSFGKHLWDFSNSLFFATTVITTIGKHIFAI